MVRIPSNQLVIFIIWKMIIVVQRGKFLPNLGFGLMRVINRQSSAGEIKTSSSFVAGDADKPERMLVEMEASRDSSELHVDDLLPPGGLLSPDMMQHAALPLHWTKKIQKHSHPLSNRCFLWNGSWQSFRQHKTTRWTVVLEPGATSFDLVYKQNTLVACMHAKKGKHKSVYGLPKRGILVICIMVMTQAPDRLMISLVSLCFCHGMF